jgi:hypothetical protein
MSVDENCFLDHLKSPPFQSGVDRGYWGQLEDAADVKWPFVFIWVQAAPKAGCPERYVLRFELSGYPQQAPTSCPWDIKAGQPLEPGRWPRGPKFVSKVFNPGWRTNAIYAPCDRAAMCGHENWRQEHPGIWWESTFTIAIYLNFVHTLLNSQDYQHGQTVNSTMAVDVPHGRP